MDGVGPNNTIPEELLEGAVDLTEAKDEGLRKVCGFLDRKCYILTLTFHVYVQE